MNRVLNFIILFISLGILNCCADNQSFSSSNLAGTTFTGVIPCADCEGIAYKITLKKDHRFETSSVYIGKSNRPFIERGSWKTKGDSLLVLNESEEQARQFRIKNEQLVMLDGQGREVSGSLSKMYVLNEADTTADHQWQRRRKQGIDFHAAGNEPSWSLDIDFDEKILFKLLEGDSVTAAVPKMQRDSTSQGRIWDTGRSPGSLRLELYPTGCVDDMSGEVFTHYVNVEYSGKAYHGCGNFINETYKLNDFWKLKTLDEEKIDTSNTANHRPELQFNLPQKEVYGNTGCNRLSGTIVLKGNSLSLSKIITTKMACSGGMQMESKFLKALQRVDRYDIANAELLLMNQQDTLLVFRRAE